MGARKWIFGGLLIVAIAVVAISVNMFRAAEERDQTKIENDLAAALARTESLGIPVYAAHLRKDPIPDEDNAWIEIAQILQRKHDGGLSTDGKYWISPLDARLTEDPVERERKTQQMVREWQPVLALAKRSAKKPGFVPEREWELGVFMLSRDPHMALEVCQVLVAEAKVRFDDGELEDSLVSLKSATTIAHWYMDQGVWIHTLTHSRIERDAAEEVLRQVQSRAPSQHVSHLRDLLSTLFAPADTRRFLSSESVLFVESMRAVDVESDFGDEFRSIGHEVGAGRNDVETTYSLPTWQARAIEAKAVNAACDFYESLQGGLCDFSANDDAFAELVTAPYAWMEMFGSTLDDSEFGLPLGFVWMYEAGQAWDTEETPGPYSRLAISVLRGEAYRAAFDHLTSIHLRQDGAKWRSEALSNAELSFIIDGGGFSITVTAPDLKPITQKFDRP